MNVNEILKFLGENKETMIEVMEKLDFMPKSEAAGLKNNWYEIKNEKKKLQKQLEAYKDFTPEMIEEYNSMKEEFEKLQGQKGKGKSEIDNQVNAKITAMQKKLDSFEANANEYKTLYQKSEMKSMINKILDTNRVKPAFKNMLLDNWINKGKLEEFDNKLELYYTDNEKGEIPLQDYANEFFKSETGQEYLMKPQNSGGNSRGNSGGQSMAVMKREQFDSLSPEEQASAATQARKGELKITD